MSRYVNRICSLLLFVALAGVSSRSNSAEMSDRELIERQARIGNIVVQVDDVFEGERLAAPYRAANALHINTRATAIEAQLLFRRGDLFDRRVLDESERLLRSQRYLNAATIEVTTYDVATNTVDVAVRVHDVWTLSPGFSFGRKGGANATRIELEENNLLGFGKRIELWHSQDVDRTSLRLRYLDPNIWGSRWRLSSAYASSSDGGEKTFDLARPFYSLDAKWSVGLIASDATASIPRYKLGEPVEQFDMRKRILDLRGGLSEGLRDGWVRRYLAGVHYESREFSPFENQAATLPADRIRGYPWLGVEWLEDNYFEARNLNQIGRTEDVHLGLAARLEAGYTLQALDSTQSAVVFAGNVSHGSTFGSQQYLFNELSLIGRLEAGKLRNASFEATSRYHLRHNEFSALFASASIALTRELDSEYQLTLGGDNGLRGYPLRYQSGTGYTLVTLEERFYTRLQPFKLFDLGAAVFFDAGKTWGNDPFGAAPMGWLKDVGLGFRLGNARSALGNVLHLDLAFPLDGPQNISRMQFIVETRRSF